MENMYLVWPRFVKVLVYLSLVVVILQGCEKQEESGSVEQVPYVAKPYSFRNPDLFPEMQIPDFNPLTVEGVELGRKLYYDSKLSNNGLSCSSCHDQKQGFTTPSSNSLAHINLGWNNSFLWNGKYEGTLEDIMMFEVEIFFNTNIEKLKADPAYPIMFYRAFNKSDFKTKDIAYALAQFFRIQVSSDSKFDKFLRNQTDLTASEMRGFNIFNTEKGDCFHCHSIPLMQTPGFYNIGLDSVYEGVAKGRYNVTGNMNDLGKFKVPTLRNIALTAPYMHDGRFQTLEEVVEHYNSGVKISKYVDPLMLLPAKEFGLELSVGEKQDLVAFLKTLTDSSFINNPELSKPIN